MLIRSVFGLRMWISVICLPILIGIQWFAPNTINDNIFRIRSARVPPTATDQFTGMITAAATFSGSPD